VEISGGTIIGSGGVTFLAVNATDPVVGIRVDDTGSNPFVISGGGAVGTGGTIASADTAIIARDDASVSLSGIVIEGASLFGIWSTVPTAGASLDLTLDGSVIRDPLLTSTGYGIALQVADGGNADITLVNDTIRDHPLPMYLQVGQGEAAANADLRFGNVDIIASPQAGGPGSIGTVLAVAGATICADWTDVRTMRGAVTNDWQLSGVDPGAFGFVGFQTDLATTFANHTVVGRSSPTGPFGPPVVLTGPTEFAACTLP
jgi:hypothetical protein